MELLNWATMGLLLAGGGMFAKRPQPGCGRHRPRRVLHPSRLAGVRGDAVWMVAGDPRCRHGKRLDGRVFVTADAPDLNPTCGHVGCRCHYQPVRDRRAMQGERRADVRPYARFDRRSSQPV